MHFNQSEIVKFTYNQDDEEGDTSVPKRQRRPAGKRKLVKVCVLCMKAVHEGICALHETTYIEASLLSSQGDGLPRGLTHVVCL